MIKTIPGGMKVADFLRRHWQKQPLFVENALPDWAKAFDRGCLETLAAREDVESRLVRITGRQWSVEHGPFSRRTLRGLPDKGWALLVQGVDLVSETGSAMLSAFDFIPRARLDDVMVSFAPPGAGVGPHFDSYDVFLVQGAGRRRWRISTQKDLTLVPGAPLRILKQFRSEAEWNVEPGDLLYLPPHVAHEGVAITDSITISIGFRAPAADELARSWLDYLQDNLDVDGRYEDPDLAFQRHPAEISRTMLDRMKQMIPALSPATTADFVEFAGAYLSEPKQNVIFERPGTIMTLRRFAQQARRHGICLALPTRMLFHGERFFINGEVLRAPPADRKPLQRLADERALPGDSITDSVAVLVHEWYCAGYLAPQIPPKLPHQ
jgi:50S ribosomal protein L16 3-hydroxylase